MLCVIVWCSLREGDGHFTDYVASKTAAIVVEFREEWSHWLLVHVALPYRAEVHLFQLCRGRGSVPCLRDGKEHLHESNKLDFADQTCSGHGADIPV